MIKQIWHSAKTEYIGWITNPRMFLLCGSLFFVYVFVVEKFIQKSDMMNGQLINFFEPYVAVLNSPLTVLIMPICYLMLMSDFPRVRPNTLFVIYRIGRYKWLASQILFFLISAMTFIIAMFLVATLPMIARSYFANGWSMVTLNFCNEFPELAISEMATLIPDRIYNHVYPFETVVFSTLTYVGYYMIMGLAMIICKLKNFSFLGIFISATLIGFGFATYLTGGVLKWVFPMSNTMLHLHYAKFLREEKFPLLFSQLYFPVIIVLLLIITFISIKKSSFIYGEQE